MQNANKKATKKERERINKTMERNIYLDVTNESHWGDIVNMGKALSSHDRIRVLNLLRLRSMSVVEVAGQLNLPVSSIAHHFKTLEEAKLILTESKPGIRGSQRIGMCCTQVVRMRVTERAHLPELGTVEVNMPVGSYFGCDVQPTCGMADEHNLIGDYDSPKSFYSQNRINAQLLWFKNGFLEYRFPNHCTADMDCQNLSFSLELCSEAPGYQENWPSDITISINNQILGTYISPGDYGARRGKLTPAFWETGATQYGLLKTFSVRESGAYIDEQLVNPKLTVASLNLMEKPYISFRVEVDPKGINQGGINIFGSKFGDFAQDIVMRIDYYKI